MNHIFWAVGARNPLLTLWFQFVFGSGVSAGSRSILLFAQATSIW